MRRISIKFLSFIAILFLGCVDTKEKTKAIVVLFDVSGSTMSFRKNFLNDFQIILDKVTHGDVIVADKITDISIPLSKLIINESMPPFTSPWYESPRKMKRKREKANAELTQKKKEIIKKVEDSILTERTIYTDIFSLLQIAESVFKTYPKDKKILVIFSDMIQDTPEYNFEEEKLTDAKIREIIEEEKVKRPLPDLTGVKIYIIGVSAKTTERYFDIWKFWVTYFNECNATLLEENYVARLLIFNE